MPEAFICDALRTPIGRYGGALAGVRPDDMAAMVLRALVERNPSVDWNRLDEVYLGCANQSGEDNRNIARMAVLLSGLPHTVPGVTVNRLCASGMDAVGAAARAIVCGDIDLALAGGVESMSRAPYVMAKAESAFQRGTELFDTTLGWRFINPVMKQLCGVDSMAQTSDNVAADYNISREDQDAFAYRSQQRAAAAQASGYFAEEILPVTVTIQKAAIAIDKDEHPRPDTSLEGLGKLKPLSPAGTTTAGNSSGINDGAAAMIVASEAAIRRYGLQPRARFLGMASAGVLPRVMGIGPVDATRKLLSKLAMTIEDFDVIEMNEAFASQSLASLRALDIADDAPHVNANGGAIALGHPLGMSGARLVLTSVHQMERTGARRALATMCVGVGQGVAIALERVQ
jgi:3-oxoadipyl-CoA thiolase